MDMNGWRPTQGGVNVGEVSRSGLGVGTGGGLGCDSGDWRTPQQAVPFSNMMDTSGWKPTDQDRDNVGGGGVSGSGFGVGTGGGLGCGSGGDWRTQLQADSRQRIVHKIMDTLKRHIPFSGQEGIQELKKIAVRFEEKIYTAATSQSDYLRLISLKMLTLETKSKNAISNSLPSSSTSDPGTVEKGELSRRSRSNI